MAFAEAEVARMHPFPGPDVHRGVADDLAELVHRPAVGNGVQCKLVPGRHVAQQHYRAAREAESRAHGDLALRHRDVVALPQHNRGLTQRYLIG